MDFTREPLIETIITPKEGCKLVVRSSKGSAQEEFFVEAVEVVSFGRASFYRSLERPKAFLVPISDYEILEVREARMVLKNVGIDRTIKIGGGKENNNKPHKAEKEVSSAQESKVAESSPVEAVAEEGKAEGKPAEKKKDKRRQFRKRRGAQEAEKSEEGTSEAAPVSDLLQENIEVPTAPVDESEENLNAPTPASLSALLQPPPTLISETINRYRENAMFKNAFFLSEDEQYKPHDRVSDLLNDDHQEEFVPVLQESEVHQNEENFANGFESEQQETQIEQVDATTGEEFSNYLEQNVDESAEDTSISEEKIELSEALSLLLTLGGDASSEISNENAKQEEEAKDQET